MNNEDSALSREALVARVANLEKQARETARRLAERNAMLESAGDAIYGIDAQGLCIFINLATAKLLGYSEQECLGRNMHELIHHTRPDGRPYPAQECPIYVNSQSGLGVKVDDEIVWRKDGTSVPVEYAARPIYLDGDIFGSIITMRDITDRRRTEAALRDSEEQFRTLAESVPQLVWMADATGWIFWYNRRWYEYTGTTAKDMEGWGWQSVHDPNELPKVMERWTASVQSGAPFEMVFPLRGGDGVFRPFLTRIIPIRDRSGAIVRWFGTNTDITDQRAAEEAVLRSQERLRASLEASGTGTFRWDTKTDALEVDESLARLLGLPSDEPMERLDDLLALVYPDDAPRLRLHLENAAKSKSEIEQEFRVTPAGGQVRWLYCRGKALPSAGDQNDSVLGACVDITARKQADERLLYQAKLAALGADVGVALTRGNSLREVLQMCTDSLVLRLDAAFARIWTVAHGENVLELQASSGMYTHIDGAACAGFRWASSRSA